MTSETRIEKKITMINRRWRVQMKMASIRTTVHGWLTNSRRRWKGEKKAKHYLFVDIERTSQGFESHSSWFMWFVNIIHAYKQTQARRTSKKTKIYRVSVGAMLLFDIGMCSWSQAKYFKLMFIFSLLVLYQFYDAFVITECNASSNYIIITYMAIDVQSSPSCSY
jgi:hypothetical protein